MLGMNDMFITVQISELCLTPWWTHNIGSTLIQRFKHWINVDLTSGVGWDGSV